MRLTSLTLSLALCSILLLLHTLESRAQILTLTPSLSVGERYDDNIFQTRDNKVDDFVTIVTPALHLRYTPTSGTDLDFEYRPSFEFFADNSGQNQVAQRLSVRLATPLTRLFSLNLRDAFVITEEPRDRVVEIDEATGLRTVSREARTRTTRNSADVALQAQLAPRVSLGLAFRSLLEDVRVPTEVDEFRYTVGAELGYLVNVARSSRVFVSSDVTFHTFSPNGPRAFDVADFRVVTVNTGFRHAFSPKLSGHITVGYAVTESDAPDGESDSNIVISAGIVRTLRTGQASFDYKRYFTSGGGEGNQVLADTFVALFSSRISPKVTASLGGNLSLYNFKNANDDRLFFTVRPNLTYNVLRFWTLSLAYSYAVVNFKESVRADETDHRLSFTSRFTLRTGLFLAVTYRYGIRRFSNASENREFEEFNRNEILLTLTYGPTFRF